MIIKKIFFNIILFINFMIAAMLFSACYDEYSSDIVMINGKIWTADNSNPYAEAIAIKDNKIIAVGTTDEIITYLSEKTEIIDLQNKRVVPGFQDSHAHFIKEAVKTNIFQDPYTPEFTEYDEQLSILSASATGSMHIAIKALNSTPMDLDILSIIPLPQKEIALSRLKRGIDELLKMGITTVFELGTNWAHYNLLLSLKEQKELKIRCELYFASKYLDNLIQSGINRHTGDEWLRVLGVKFYADGWLAPRTCALRDNYSDETFIWQKFSDYKGILFMGQEKANEDILKAHKADLKIATHTIGDMGVEVILNAYENALNLYPDQNHRHTLEHASILSPDLITKIKSLDVIASIQLSFVTSDMYFIEKALSAERAKYTYAWKTLLKNKIKCAGGSDFPIETISPLWGIQRIVTRQDLNGYPEGGWHPEERLTVEEALRLITINSAYNSFEEDIKGSIEVGKLADIIVLSDDILEIPPNEISNIKVELTMVDGKVVYKSDDTDL